MSNLIKPNSIDNDGAEVHQTSPGYVLTFLRWEIRDTIADRNTELSSLGIRDPLIVINDAVNVTVSVQKGKSASFSAALVYGDINYSTAIAPGDIVIVNMVNWESKVLELHQRASSLSSINRFNDGFKGIFKIVNVSRQLMTSDDGRKSYRYSVSGQAFSELDTTIVYNPAIAEAFKEKSRALYTSLIGDYYSDFLRSTNDCETLIQSLFKILLGEPYRTKSIEIPDYGQTHYALPSGVARLMGRGNSKYANEIYNLITGTWRDSSKQSKSVLSQYFNPGITLVGGKNNIYSTNVPMLGNKFIAPEDWNYKTAWSIMSDHLNGTMNEMYASFRADPITGNIYPTVVARQKPFNNTTFTPPPGNFPVTYFKNLPYWKLSPSAAVSFNFGKNEALRFNFVQVYTRGLAATQALDFTNQIFNQNFVEDADDIQRHGMKPYTVSSNFDFPIGGEKRIRAKEWSIIVADWVMNGQLKESGTITCIGIEEPIAVGDNLLFDGVVYHIEAVVHNFQIAPDGRKVFRTNLSLSYGIDVRSDKNQLVFTEMEHTDGLSRGEEDYASEKILPGFGEAQDIPSRATSKGEEIKRTRQKSFIIPNKKKSPPIKPGNDNGNIA
jgi:hypothetical protein